MAVVMPTLRLWLLLLNLYGTFKAMKRPPISQRNARNGQRPSARAMQLRKRELKSRLAVWVVWAMFSTMEGPLDRTIGFVTPFYNEFKCIILLFLLVSRSHGAEAIFLHIIHPLLRPYVPAVDDILANLHSVFELIVLLLFLPWEYVSNWWRHWHWSWSWTKKAEPAGNDDLPWNGPQVGYASPDGQRRLLPRTELHQGMREANRQAQVVFRDIDDAQDRVRTRSQLAAQVNARNQPVRGGRGPEPGTVGMRTRRRALELPSLPSDDVIRGPGSRSTGVHQIHRPPQILARQPFTEFPYVPIQSVPLMSQPAPIPTPPSSDPSHHEIWHPPPSTFEGRRRRTTPPRDSARRTPSPIYPPLPSAYPLTPRRSDPLPSPPRITSPPDLATPTPRRLSTGAMSPGAFDAFEGIDQFLGPSGHASSSINEQSMEPSHPLREVHEPEVENFFGQALEPLIQAADMDMDMETLSTRDGSSATEYMEEGGKIEADLANTAELQALSTVTKRGSVREVELEGEKGRRKATTAVGPLRRSSRKRDNQSSSVKTDEFGFTIRPELSILGRAIVGSATGTGPSKKKPLARSKPSLKPTEEETETESSDEESVKKKRKLRSNDLSSLEYLKLPDNREMTSQQDGSGVRKGKGRRKAVPRSTGTTQAVMIDRQPALYPTHPSRTLRQEEQPVDGTGQPRRR